MNVPLVITIGRRTDTKPTEQQSEKKVHSAPSVFLTGHALKRFKERFKFTFHKDLFENASASIFLKRKFLESSQIDFALRQKVGLYNAVCIHYGKQVRYSKSGKIAFIWYNDAEYNRNCILTVLRSERVKLPGGHNL